MKPIMEFKDQEQLRKVGKEWIERLRLTNWIITLDLCELEKGEEQTSGIILTTPCKKVAEIRINSKKIEDEAIVICKEKTLVHELLHCYICMYGGGDSLISVTYTDNEHSNLDVIARALIMAKYNLPSDWFNKQK